MQRPVVAGTVVLAIAAFALNGAIWLGIGVPIDGPLERLRLPWTDATLASTPGLSVPEDQWSDWRDSPWPRTLAFVVFPCLVLCALYIALSERKVGDRYAPTALLAAILFVGGALFLSHAAELHAWTPDLGPPSFTAWKTVPAFAAPAIAIFALSAVAAAAALGSIALAARRGERRRGLVLAIVPLVLSLQALVWIDLVFLSPQHAQPPRDTAPVELPPSAHATMLKPDPRDSVICLDLWPASEGVRASLTHTPGEGPGEATPPQDAVEAWQGGLDDATWRATLAAMVVHMPLAPRDPEALVADVPDGLIRLRADARLDFDDVRPVIAAIMELGVWKLAIGVAGPKVDGTDLGTHYLFRYVHPQLEPSDEPWLELQSRAGEPSLSVQRVTRAGEALALNLRIGSEASWGSFVQLVDSYPDVIDLRFAPLH